MKSKRISVFTHMENFLNSVIGFKGPLKLTYGHETYNYFMDKKGDFYFAENIGPNSLDNVHWIVSDELKTMFDFFGVELFVEFVNKKFDINLSDKGEFDYDWVFR